MHDPANRGVAHPQARPYPGRPGWPSRRRVPTCATV